MKETRRDPYLGKIIQLLESGQSLIRHGCKAPESNYSLTCNCIIFGHRVVAPPLLREAILKDLQTAPLGIEDESYSSLICVFARYR